MPAAGAAVTYDVLRIGGARAAVGELAAALVNIIGERDGEGEDGSPIALALFFIRWHELVHRPFQPILEVRDQKLYPLVFIAGDVFLGCSHSLTSLVIHEAEVGG